MLLRLLMSSKKYSVSGYVYDENGETVVLFSYPNKRISKPFEMKAKKILDSPRMRLLFRVEDIIEMTKRAERDRLIAVDAADELPVSKNTYTFYPYLVAVAAVMWCFCAIIGHRFAYFHYGDFSITLPGAILVFPVIYFCADAIQEIYGYQRARQTLWVCIVAHLFLVLCVSFVLSFTPAPNVDAHAYDVVLHTQWRMFIGNAFGMIVGFTINGIILAKMKVAFDGKHLWLRSILSTLIAESFYSIACSSIAFNDALSFYQLIKLQAGMVAIKASWEVVFTPVLYLVIWLIKNKEGVDVYDRYISFNPFSFKVESQSAK